MKAIACDMDQRTGYKERSSRNGDEKLDESGSQELALVQDLPPNQEPQTIRRTRRIVYSPSPTPSTNLTCSPDSWSFSPGPSNEIISDVETLPDTDEDIDFSSDIEYPRDFPRNFPSVKKKRKTKPLPTLQPFSTTRKPRERSKVERSASRSRKATRSYRENKIPSVPSQPLFSGDGTPQQSCQEDVENATSVDCQDGGGGGGGGTGGGVRDGHFLQVYSDPVFLPPPPPLYVKSSGSQLSSSYQHEKPKLRGGFNQVPGSQPMRHLRPASSPCPSVLNRDSTQCPLQRNYINAGSVPYGADPDDVFIGGLRAVPTPHSPQSAPDWSPDAPYITRGRSHSARPMSRTPRSASPTAREMGCTRAPSGPPRNRQEVFWTPPQAPRSAYQEIFQPNIYWDTAMDPRIRNEQSPQFSIQLFPEYMKESQDRTYCRNENLRPTPARQFRPAVAAQPADIYQSHQVSPAYVSTIQRPQESIQLMYADCGTIPNGSQMQFQPKQKQKIPKDMQLYEDLAPPYGIPKWPSASTVEPNFRPPPSVAPSLAAPPSWHRGRQPSQRSPPPCRLPPGRAPSLPPQPSPSQELTSEGCQFPSWTPPVATTSSQTPVDLSVPTSPSVKTVTSSSQTPPCSVYYSDNNFNEALKSERSAEVNATQPSVPVVRSQPCDSLPGVRRKEDLYVTESTLPPREVKNIAASSVIWCSATPPPASINSMASYVTAPCFSSTTNEETALKQTEYECTPDASYAAPLEDAGAGVADSSLVSGDDRGKEYPEGNLKSISCGVQSCEDQLPAQGSTMQTDASAEATQDGNEQQVKVGEKGESADGRMPCENKDNDSGNCDDNTKQAKESKMDADSETADVSARLRSLVYNKTLKVLEANAVNCSKLPGSLCVQQEFSSCRDFRLCRSCCKNYKGNQGSELEF